MISPPHSLKVRIGRPTRRVSDVPIGGIDLNDGESLGNNGTQSCEV